MQDANLAGTNLKKADLRFTNLTGVDFTKADLRGANLNGAIYSQANLSEATLSRVNFDGAILVGANLKGACADPEPLAVPSLGSSPMNQLQALCDEVLGPTCSILSRVEPYESA